MNFDGNIAEKYNYDAWGRRRNPDTWAYTNVPEPTLIDFGFTSHSLSRSCGKHWDKVNVINMTGRLYSLSREERIGNPYLARFLNADPYVSEPQNSQVLNRYTYVNNNPLIYNDPTGEVWQAAVYLGWKYLKTAHDNRDRETGEWDWKLKGLREKNGDLGVISYFLVDINLNFNGGFNVEGSLNVNGMPVAGFVYEPENTGIPQSERELASLIGINTLGGLAISAGEEIYNSKYNIDLSNRYNQLKPYHIDINTGKHTWGNPKILANKRVFVNSGNLFIFVINEYSVFRDYFKGGNLSDFATNTSTNILSSSGPQWAAMFITFSVGQLIENAWIDYNNRPDVQYRNYRFDQAHEDWIYNMGQGGY